MATYFAVVEYYPSLSASAVENESMLLTDYTRCLDAWMEAVSTASCTLKRKGLARFTIVKFEKVL